MGETEPRATRFVVRDSSSRSIVAAFFVRVIPSQDGIANAAQTLGQRYVSTVRGEARHEITPNVAIKT